MKKIIIFIFISMSVYAELPKEYNNFLCKYKNSGMDPVTINIFCDYNKNICKSEFIEDFEHESLIWDNTIIFYDAYDNLTFFLTKNDGLGAPSHNLITIYKRLSNQKIVTKGELMEDPINVLPSVRTQHNDYAPSKNDYNNKNVPAIRSNADDSLGICIGSNKQKK